MINVVCVKNGSLYGAEYVNILFDMVCRNLGPNTKFKFFCFTNDDATEFHEAIQVKPIPDNLVGWWAKLYLFKEGLFPDGERIIYIDLSTVIVSGLDKIFAYEGDFAIVRDFYRPDGLQSCFMAWKVGKLDRIWSRFADTGFRAIEGGDQAFIEQCVLWAQIPKPDIFQDIFPGDFVSYKAHCQNGVPKGSKVVKFHGVPMPHQIESGWVPQFWKIGGLSSLELMNAEANTKLDKLKENISYALGEGIPVLEAPSPEHDRHAVIVGGGPSINGFVEEIRRRSEDGQDIVALNNSWKWLEKRDIKTDYHAMVDARPENVEFILPAGNTALRLYATQCDSRLITLAKGENTLLWNSYIDALADHFQDRNMFWVGSGTSIGVRSIFLLYTLGYRKFHLYGYDSSYVQEEGHAYEQKLNHGEKTIKVSVHNREFMAAPWMVSQSQDFLETMEYLTERGCQFTIHGDGLLPYMASTCLIERKLHTDFSAVSTDTASDLRCKAILKRIEGIENPVGVEVGVFAGDLSKRLLLRPDLKLTMVDSWEEHGVDSEYAKSGDFHGVLSRSAQDSYYKHTMEVTRFAGERAVILRKSSIEAAKDFEDGSLDFVFLDADHTYEAVRADIAAWYPKVKRGGLLCGHDYANHEFPAWGVEKAVSELCLEKGLTVDLGHNFTWFVTTPRENENGTR